MNRSTSPISITHPSIAIEAFGWDPATVTAGSNKKLTWQCSRKHLYAAPVSKRTALGHGCPFCSGHRVLAGFNDISTTHPHLANEAHGWDPRTISAGSNKKLTWKCPKGHVFESVVAERSIRNATCPICIGRRVLAGFNDISTTHPHLANEAHGWDPRTVSAGSNKKLTWKCPKGHVFESVVASRTKGAGCHFCSGHRVLQGLNDLLTTHPDLAASAHGWDPRTISAGSNKKLKWKCPKGHVFESVVTSRVQSPDGCPICYGRQTLAGFNDLATTHPEIAKEASGWDPSTVTAGSGKKREWKCLSGHCYLATVNARTRGDECPICSGHQVKPGFNDLATTHPIVGQTAYQWDPSTLTAGSNKLRDWICDLGHTWKTSVNQRVNTNGCPFCLGSRVLQGFNDLATTHPDLSAEADGWDPTTKSKGSDAKVAWRCVKGHTYRASISNRVRGTGCPSCASFGFTPAKDGWIYLVENTELRLLQIGITNTPEQRLKQHKKTGFADLLDIRGPMDGELARRTEAAILSALKSRNVAFSQEVIDLRFIGFTESWSATSLRVASIKELLEFVHEDESQP
jgi:hypothetical protein